METTFELQKRFQENEDGLENVKITVWMKKIKNNVPTEFVWIDGVAETWRDATRDRKFWTAIHTAL